MGHDAEYRIEELALRGGTSVRTVRGYQDRGLLPRPRRRGRANVYGESHLRRLRQIADLLDRGYTLTSIEELLRAWGEGRDLGGVLGLPPEAAPAWPDETPALLTRPELTALFGGVRNEEAVREAVHLGVLVPCEDEGNDGRFLVPSPRELWVAVELHRAGVPLLSITEQLHEVRAQVEQIALRFLDFAAGQLFVQGPPERAAALMRRLRPQAQRLVAAELARAMRELALRRLREPRAPDAAAVPPVLLPTALLDAVRDLVGPGDDPAGFVAAAAEREVRARTP